MSLMRREWDSNPRTLASCTLSNPPAGGLRPLQHVNFLCGKGEIRTLGTVSRTLAFQASAFDHSATFPYFSNIPLSAQGGPASGRGHPSVSCSLLTIPYRLLTDSTYNKSRRKSTPQPNTLHFQLVMICDQLVLSVAFFRTSYLVTRISGAYHTSRIPTSRAASSPGTLPRKTTT